MYSLLIILIILTTVYLFTLRGRTGQAGYEAFQGWRYAHRGLYSHSEVPENSLAAFKLAVERGYGIEFDVHLLSDGNLAVMHDSLLQRTTGEEGKLEQLSTNDLKNYHLEGTDQTIPTFEQVLKVVDGKSPMIIELKTDGNNASALCAEVTRQIEGYSGVYCVESFDPRCIMWFKKNRPDFIRGQLSCNGIRKDYDISLPVKVVLSLLMANFMTRPDFVAYSFADREFFPNKLALKLWHLHGVSWTIKTAEELKQAEKEGLLPIFEGFTPPGNSIY